MLRMVPAISSVLPWCVSQAANLAATTANPRHAPGGSFNRSVESQQVGLLADFLDQADTCRYLGATG